MSGLIVVVTGANQGVGFEACRQFALAPNVAKILLTCRSASKANKAIDELVASTGKERSLFDFVVLDLDSKASAEAAVQALPARVDRLVLNAGVISTGVVNGVTAVFASTVGHATLTEGLLAAEKLQPGARVLYAHTEVSRFIPAFTGLQPCCIGLKPGTDLHNKVTVERSCLPPCFCVPTTNQLGSYAYAKIVGGLWISKLAAERPEIYFISVSPGGVYTKIYEDMAWPGGCFIKTFLCLMEPLGIMHSAETGAKRYVDAMLNDDFPEKFKAGTVLGSPCGCCNIGASGPLTDQAALGCCARAPYMVNAELMADAATKVRALSQAPGAQPMDRGATN